MIRYEWDALKPGDEVYEAVTRTEWVVESVGLPDPGEAGHRITFKAKHSPLLGGEFPVETRVTCGYFAGRLFNLPEAAR